MPAEHAARARVDAWNATWPPGTPVTVIGIGRTVTTGPAVVDDWGAYICVRQPLWHGGIPVRLDNVRPVAAAPIGPAALRRAM